VCNLAQPDESPFVRCSDVGKRIAKSYIHTTSLAGFLPKKKKKRKKIIYSVIQVALRSNYLAWLPRLLVLNTGQGVISCN